MLSRYDSPELIATVGTAVDWSHPNAMPFAAEYQQGDTAAALIALIHRLRARVTPNTGYTAGYLSRLRASASEAERQEARERVEATFAQDLLMPYHSNAFAALGAETLLLGMDDAACARLADHVWENHARWHDGYFGVAGSISHLIRYLWPLPECADDCFLPLFGWLLTRTTDEWENARTWSEATLGTSGHNWWAHCFIGLWSAGLCFPEFTALAPFAGLLPEYLERELTILFEEDGWSKEGSAGYHQFAFSNLLEGATLAALNGIILPEVVHQRLWTIANAAWQLVTPDAEYPVFGDAVRQGRYVGFGNSQRPDRTIGILLRRLAARFSIPEAKAVAETLDPEWQRCWGVLPDNGADLLPVYHRLPTRAPSSPDTCLPRSGFYVMRQDWTPRADWVGIEAGALGNRVTSHKHASLLNFELYARGRRLLVDNWYGSVVEERADDRERMWRVSSAAHNVATVDEQDHIPIVREFLFGGVVTPTVDGWHSTDQYAYFSGVHEGYLRLPEPVTAHRRKLFYLRGQYWILIDRFTPATAAEHRYQLHFHLNAPSELLADGRVVTRGEGGNLLIVPVPGADGQRAIAPNPYPLDGYENPDHLTYSRQTAGHPLFVTVLAPFADAAMPEIAVELIPVQADGRELDPWEVTGLRLTIDGREDFYLDHHMQWSLPWQLGAYAGTTRLFHSAVK